jgi:transcriptional regulator with XRE-family HTH domain
MRPKRIPPLPRTPSEYQALGRAIRELRIDHGLSQAALAKRCLTCRGHISLIERGQGNPTFASILCVLHALDAELGLSDLTAIYRRHFRPQPRPQV